MNKTKRFLGLFLVVFMLLAFVPLQALANTVDEIAPAGSDSQTTEVASATDETQVAMVNGTGYATLAEALEAAVVAGDSVTVKLLADVNLTGTEWTPVYFDSYIASGANTLVIDGNYCTITGLSDMLFSGIWTGTKFEVKNLTIDGAYIQHDAADAIGTIGVGAIVGNVSAIEEVVLDNVKLTNSHVEGGHWTGGFFGYIAGYSGNDGPVFTTVSITNSEVSDSEIVGKGSVGGVVGHATGDAWTSFGIESSTVIGNTITSTGSSTNKAGIVAGTIGAAGTAQTTNGTTLTGGVSVSVTETENEATSNGEVITTVYGRQGSSTGVIEITGGTYENYPIEENVPYAAPAEGYAIKENANGTYGVEEAASYVAEVNGEKFDSVLAALTYAIENNAQEVKILESAREVMPTDVELVINANLTITADAPVEIRFYNDGTSYDFIINSNNNNVFTIAENVSFILEDRVIWLGYYGNNVDVVVNGTLSGYQIWHGADTTVNATGTLATTCEALVMRRGATMTVNGGKVDANYFTILAGNIVAENATIESGAFWIDNNSNYAGEGNVDISLKNSTLTGSSNLKSSSAHANGVKITIDNSTVSFTGNEHGASVVDAKTTIEIKNSADVTFNKVTNNGTITLSTDASLSTAGETDNVVSADPSKEAVYNETTGKYEFVDRAVAKVGDVEYSTLADAVAAVKANGGTLVLLDNAYESMTFNYPEDGAPVEITIDLNGFTVTSAESTLWVSDGYIVTVKDSVGTGKIVTTSNSDSSSYEAIAVNRDGKVILEGGTVEAPYYGVFLYSGNTIGKEVFVMNGGKVVVPNGGQALSVSTGKATINGGDVICEKNVGGAGWNTVVYENGVVEITGGNFYATIGNWGTISISGGTFSYPDDPNDGFNSAHLAAGYGVTEVDGKFVVAKLPVSIKIGDVEYATLQEAVNNAKEGDVIVISGTVNEGTVKLPAALKNVTFQGADDAVVLNTVIQSHDGNSISYEGITFDGIVFDNSKILITGWRTNGVALSDWTITDCTFKNIVATDNIAPVHFNLASSEAVNGFVFTNNVIDNLSGGQQSGIYAALTGNITITDSVFNKTAFRPMLIQLADCDGIADNIVISGNTFSGNSVGRVQIYGSEADNGDGTWTPVGTDKMSFVLTKNIFKDITATQQICTWGINAETVDISGNYYDVDVANNPANLIYWNNVESTDIESLADMGVFPIYTELNDDGTINEESAFTPASYVAQIGEAKYSTIVEALNAAQNGDTIVLLADCALSEVVELRDIAITIEGDYTITLNDNLKVFGETTLNITSVVDGEVWLDDGAILKDSYINGSVFVGGNVTFRGENSVAMLYDFGVLTSNYGTAAEMKWTVEEGASLEIRNKARYGLGYGDSVTIYGSIEDALTARESLTEGDVAFFAHGLVAQENTGWNKDNYFTVKDAYVVIGSNNSFGNKPGSYGGNYSFVFNNVVLDSSRITFYEATSKTELSFTSCDVVTGTFMTRDADSKFTLVNTKLLSTTTTNGTDEGNYNDGALILVNSSLTYSAQLTNNGTITLDINSCLTAPKIIGNGTFVIDVTGLTEAKTVISADMSEFTGEIELVNGNAKCEIVENGVVVSMLLAGSGTESDPYQIASSADLATFAQMVNGGKTFKGEYVKLMNSVDLAPAVVLMSTSVSGNWEPIGTKDNPFMGTFDGSDYTVSNLVIEGTNNVGFFGYVTEAHINNLKIENVTVVGSNCVGAVVGQGYASTYIDNCHVSGNIQITGNTNVGGIVGKYYARVTNSSVIGDGVATSFVKGVYVGADLEGDNVGGIMGHAGENNNHSGNTVMNIKVSGTRKVGGLIGTTDRATNLDNCTVDTVVVESTATADYVAANTATSTIGGLIGNYYGGSTGGTVTNCAVESIKFNLGNALSAGPIVGGNRTTPGEAPTGVTYSGNAIDLSTIQGATNYYLMVLAAEINDVKYTTLKEAIAALKDGDTLTIFAGTYSEGTIKFPASLKNVTIVGESGATLKDMTLMASDGSNISYEYITFDGIVFENTNLLFPGQRASAVFNNWTITNCVFNNVERGNAAINFNLNASEAMENFTFTNNVINGVTGGNYSGLVLRAAKGDIVISGNDISNVAWNAIQLINTTADTLTITGNTFASSADEGILNLYGVTATTLTIKENKFLVSEGQPGVCYITAADVSENYWGGNAPANLPEGVTFTSYYADAELTVLVTINYVAQIGDVKFESLADAINAAVEGDTIVLLANVAGDFVVNEGQSIIIDLNGYDIVGSIHAITNNGTLVINDTVGTGNVYTTDVSAQGRATIVNNGTITINGGWFGDSNNDTTDRNAINRGNAIKNYGVATINGGYFTNVSNQYIDTNAYAYAINTLAGGTTTINNATVYGDINGLIYSDGKTIVNDGSFTLGRPGEENNLWYLAYGDVEIKGGTWTRAFAVPSWNTGDPTFEGTVQVSGGTFNVNVKEQYCAEGCGAIQNLDGKYVVGELPTATVNNLGPAVIPEGDWTQLSGGAATGSLPLSFVMQFLADQTAEDMATSPYADWYADFVITFTGIENGSSFTADGCYLAGYYGDFGWIKVPVDGMTVEEGARYPVMLGYGAGQKYDYICESVKDFRCALFLTPEILAANPNLEVNLELAVVDNSKGSDAALQAMVEGTSHNVADIDYVAKDFVIDYVAQIGDKKFASLADAIAAAAEGDTIVLLDDVTVDKTLEIAADKSFTLDLAGKTITAGWNDEAAGKHIYAITNNGTLVITGNGTINTRGIYNYGNLTLESGTINAIDANGGYGVQCLEGATFTMNGGAINTTNEDGDAPGAGYDATTVRVEEGATFIMNGGTINNISNFTFAIYNLGTTTIYDGTVTSVHTTVANYGTITINGGEFTCNGLEGVTAHAIWAASGKTTINGGTFDGKDNYNGFNVDASEGAVVDINGGNFLSVHSGSLYGDGTITVYGGTFFDDVAARCAEGYGAIKNLDGNYVVGEKPTATVNNLGSVVIPEGEWTQLSGGTATGGLPLSFVMQFIADQDAEDMATSPYADWYADFVITFTGIENGSSFTADGCYLAGYYGDFGWIKVPVDGMTVEEGARYPVMLGYGAGQKYDYICESVKDFRCALFLTPEILAANPNLEVNLELAVVDNSKGSDAALQAMVEGTSHNVADIDYVAKDFVVVAQVGDKLYASLQEAIDAAGEGDTITLLADITVSSDLADAAKGLYNIAADDKITIDLNGKTINVTDNSTGNFIVFYNYGELTIKNGTVNVTSTNNRLWNAQSTVILNRGGILTIESGSYVHNGGTDMAITVDNSGNSFGDAYLYVNGGTIESTYVGIRLRMADPSLNGNPGNGLVYTEITGGEIYGGSRGIWAQITNATSDELGSLAITGGTIGGGNNSLRITTDGHDNIDVTISGDAVINGAIGGEGSDFAITGGTFDTPVAAELCADGYIPCDNGDGTYGVKLGKYVATVNGVGYETVTEAIKAANDGDTVQLLAGTITETINPWGTDSTHASEKSITIVGADNFGTTLTGGLVLGYDDSGCRAHTITIKGIVFEGMGVVVAGQQTVVIEGNKFTDITAAPVSASSANANAISVIGKNVNATVTDNIIDGVAVAGINLRDILNATVSGNTITNTQHNSITITTTSGSAGTVNVNGNNLSDWGLGGEGRAVRISGGNIVYVYNNVMTYEGDAPEEFVKVTNVITGMNLSQNYWNGKSPLEEGVFEANVAPSNYYADAEFTTLIKIAKWTEASLTFGSDLKMNFYLTASSLDSTASYVKIVKTHADGCTDTEEVIYIDVKDWFDATSKDGVALKKIVVEGIAAKEMNCTITAQIFAGTVPTDGAAEGTALSAEVGTSVVDYALYLIREYNGADAAAVKTFAVDMLNYGAAAQEYFHHYEDKHLANADLTEAEKALATPTVDENAVETIVYGKKAYADKVTVEMETSIYLNFYFNNLENLATDYDKSKITAVVSYTDHYDNDVVTTFTADDLVFSEDGGQVKVSVQTLAPADASLPVMCVLYYDQAAITAVSSSISAYCEWGMSEEDVLLNALCEKIMKYSQSAYNYFHTQTISDNT